MDAQKIFDRVARHLARQGKKAINRAETCLYRGPSGTKCAVGCLIKDSEYKKSMEAKDVIGLVEDGLLPKRLLHHADLLNALQGAHDMPDTGSGVVRALQGVARERRLRMGVLRKLKFPAEWK